MNKLTALTTLNQSEYDKLFSVFSPLIEEKISLYTLKGKDRASRKYKESKRSSLFGSDQKLKFILIYLKEYPNQEFMASYCQMSQSKVSEWIQFILPVLLQALGKLNVIPKTGNEFTIPDHLDYILCDVTERQINRNIDYEVQKEFFSGKQKAHTVKNLILSDYNQYVYFLGETYEGSMHDKEIWNQLTLKKSAINILADLGFLGADKQHKNVVLPFKNSKKMEITPLQKQINKGISSLRIKVEHAFSSIKRLKILKQKINLKRDEIKHQVMIIATALHNLRVRFRLLNN